MTRTLSPRGASPQRPTIAAPERSRVQRMDALGEANRIRTKRAELKRDMKAGRVRARDVLLDPPEWADTMKVVNLLLAAPKLGRVKATAILRRADVSPSKTLSGLSTRQRAALAATLR